jgi:hypothetical protein
MYPIRKITWVIPEKEFYQKVHEAKVLLIVLEGGEALGHGTYGVVILDEEGKRLIKISGQVEGSDVSSFRAEA